MIDREGGSGGSSTDPPISRRAVLIAIPAVVALATGARSGSIGFGHIPTEIKVPPLVEANGVAPQDSFEVRVRVEEADDVDDGFIPLEYAWSPVGTTVMIAAPAPSEQLAILTGSLWTEPVTLYVPDNPDNYGYFVITAYPTVSNPPPPLRKVLQRRGA